MDERTDGRDASVHSVFTSFVILVYLCKTGRCSGRYFRAQERRKQMHAHTFQKEGNSESSFSLTLCSKSRLTRFCVANQRGLSNAWSQRAHRATAPIIDTHAPVPGEE